MNIKIEIIEEIQLNNDQVTILKSLFNKRFRIFLTGFIGSFIFWLQVTYKHLILWYTIHFKIGISNVDVRYFDNANNFFWSSIALFLLINACFLYLLFKSILPLYKDIKHNIGIITPMEIIRKSIPYHNRCFFFFDDLKTPYKEVNFTIYYNYKTGDKYPILKAKHSKILVDEFLNIPLI